MVVVIGVYIAKKRRAIRRELQEDKANGHCRNTGQDPLAKNQRREATASCWNFKESGGDGGFEPPAKLLTV